MVTFNRFQYHNFIKFYTHDWVKHNKETVLTDKVVNIICNIFMGQFTRDYKLVYDMIQTGSKNFYQNNDSEIENFFYSLWVVYLVKYILDNNVLDKKIIENIEFTLYQIYCFLIDDKFLDRIQNNAEFKLFITECGFDNTPQIDMLGENTYRTLDYVNGDQPTESSDTQTDTIQKFRPIRRINKWYAFGLIAGMGILASVFKS